MVLIRDVFQLQFGAAREAVALWKEGADIIRREMPAQSVRLLTDVVGAPYYTLVLESTYESLAAFEEVGRRASASEAWQTWYRRFVPLARHGHREIYNVVG